MKEIKTEFNNIKMDKDNPYLKMTPLELAEEKAKMYNESEGNLNGLDGYECNICKNKGYIEFVKIDTLTNTPLNFIRDCECMKKRKTIRKANNSGLGEYLTKRSNDYLVEEEWQRKNKQMLVEYCTNHAENGTWFSALGTSGSGKTLICSIIANHLLFNLGKNVLYVTWTDFISKLKRDIMSDNTNIVNIYLEEIKKTDVLFLDELLKKYNETDLKYIIEIINYRYTNNLKTLITSEKTIDELLDIDEATFSRVIEKCKGYIINMPKDRNKNYRIKNNPIL